MHPLNRAYVHLRIAFIGATAILFSLAGMTGPGVAAEKKPIKIGISQLLSGSHATFFQKHTVDPAILAVEEINNKGGINGRKIVFVVEDNKGNAATGLSVAKKLISVDKVEMIFISVSPATLASIPVAEENKVIMMAISEHPDITKSKWAFRPKPVATNYGISQAKFAYETLGARRAALLGEINDAVRVQEAAFRSEFKRLGGKIVVAEGFKTDQQNFLAQVTKIRAANPDIFVVNSVGARSCGLAPKQAAELGFKPKNTIGRTQCADEEARRIAGDLVKGVYYTTGHVDPQFAKRYASRFKGARANTWTAQSYDAIKIYFEARGKAGNDDPEKIRMTLTNLTGYQGAQGVFGFGGRREVNLLPKIAQVKK